MEQFDSKVTHLDRNLEGTVKLNVLLLRQLEEEILILAALPDLDLFQKSERDTKHS